MRIKCLLRRLTIRSICIYQGLLLVGAVLAGCTEPNPAYDPTLGHKRVFVTAAAYLGSEPSASSPSGQHICDNAVLIAALSGNWHPWLSSQLIFKINAWDEIPDVGPWFDLRGTVIFRDKEDLRRGPRSPLQVTELGHDVPLGEPIWTGTLPDGTRSLNVCLSQVPYRIWYANDASARGDVGLVGALDQRWTYASSLDCNQAAHLICLEK